MQAAIQRKIHQWVANRIPPVDEIELSHREIFILPTSWGIMFLGLIGLLIITGINYQNSMILAVGFFLLSVFVLNIVLAYRNFSSFRLRFHHAEPCFRQGIGGFEFFASSSGKAHSGIEFGWVPDSFSVVTLAPEEEVRVMIEMSCSKRGRYRPGRMLLTSTYPMGLIRAWSWQDPNASILVYPRPVEGEARGSFSEGENESETFLSMPGQEDFQGLKTYIPGESLQRVAWKKYAQSGEFFSKEFGQPSADPEWIDYDQYRHADLELALGQMCYQVVTMNAAQKVYGLKLPGLRIEPGYSENHYRTCLEALAVYRSEQVAE